MLRISRKGHHRKSYIKDTKKGLGIKLKRIPPAFVDRTTYFARDTGARGRTPKAKRWSPDVKGELGWRKDMPVVTRRALLLGVVRREGLKTAVGRINWLANITADRETKVLARADQRWLSAKFKKKR